MKSQSFIVLIILVHFKDFVFVFDYSKFGSFTHFMWSVNAELMKMHIKWLI